MLKESDILWSSPMSANTLSNTYILEFSSAEMFKPEHAIQVSKPIVFKETVLPPVFGPVISSVEKSCPTFNEIGTTLFSSIKGWRAFFKFISLFVFKIGVIPLSFFEYLALANIKSSFPD